MYQIKSKSPISRTVWPRLSAASLRSSGMEAKKYGGTSESTTQTSYRQWRSDKEGIINDGKGSINDGKRKSNQPERNEAQSNEVRG